MHNRFIYIFSILLFTQACTHKRIDTDYVVQPEYRDIMVKEDILPIKDSLVKPVIYTRVISLEKLPVKEKKQKFIELLLPAILLAEYELNKELSRVSDLEIHLKQGTLISHSDTLFLNRLHRRYKTCDIGSLKECLQPHPTSIVLGQAALESGWGSSRFFNEANNVFGIWSYNASDYRLKAAIARDSSVVYVKRYHNIEESIEDYFGTIARVNTYSQFRKKRTISQNPFDLIPYLHGYSEMGVEYTDKLKTVIKANNLTQYDKYRIDPQYIRQQTIQVQR